MPQRATRSRSVFDGWFLGSLCAILLLACSSAANAQSDSWRHVIDGHVTSRLSTAGITPTQLASDAAFLRRVTLDLIGRQPTLAELESYEQDESADKRQKTVDRLLADPAFVRYQAAELDQMLMGDVKDSLHPYLETALQEGKSWDQIFTEIILATDTKEGNPAAVYYKSRISDLDKLTNSVSVSFFGVNVSCAQCHDHPLAFEWTQGHFYGMKSFFGRMFQNGKRFGERDYGAVTYKDTEGTSFTADVMFLTGEVAPEPPWWDPSGEAKKQERAALDAQKKEDQPPSPPAFSRRAQLVRTALSAENRHYFSRSIVNHTWRRLVGRGIVSPVDQMHPANDPSHPELLEQLSEVFANDGYHLRALIKSIVLTDTYARSSVWAVSNAEDTGQPDAKQPDAKQPDAKQPDAERPSDEYFAVGHIRGLTPQQYGGSIMLAATSPDRFRGDDGAKVAESVARGGDFIAKQLEYPGDDFQIGVREALFFSNSEEVQNRVLRSSGDSLIKSLVDQSATDQTAAIRMAFRNTLCRLPDDNELSAAQEYLTSRQDRADSAWQQVVWALIMSSEFRFNH